MIEINPMNIRVEPFSPINEAKKLIGLPINKESKHQINCLINKITDFLEQNELSTIKFPFTKNLEEEEIELVYESLIALRILYDFLDQFRWNEIGILDTIRYKKFLTTNTN